MPSQPRIGFYSPFLPVAQKAALKLLEEGLAVGDEDKVCRGTSQFLEVSFLLTREAVQANWPSLDLATLELIREDDSDSAEALSQFLWNGDELSAFGRELLRWQEAAPDPTSLKLEVVELNNYLVASVDFYQSLRSPGEEDEAKTWETAELAIDAFALRFPSSLEGASPTLVLAGPQELPDSLELSALVEALATEDEPLEAEGEPALKLLWEEVDPPEMLFEEPGEGLLALPDAPGLELVWGPPQDEVQPEGLEFFDPERLEPEAPEPEAGASKPAEADVIEPKAGASELAEPEALEPEVGTSELAEAEVLEPEAEVSEPAETRVLEPEGEARTPEAEVAEPVQLDASQPLAAPPPSRANPALAPAPAPEDDGLELLETSVAPSSPLEKKSHLIVKKKYLGYGKNTDGVMGYCGHLTLSRFDDGDVNAQVESSSPLLFLYPTTLAGKTPVLTYWMPPAAFPQPSGHLTIKSQEGSKVLSIGSLFPQSRTDFLKGGHVLLLLLAPSILGLLYFAFVYVLSAAKIVEQVKIVFPDAYATAVEGYRSGNLAFAASADFRSQGVGLYQLEVVPAAESLQLIWVGLLWFCPLLASKFFRHLSRARQRDFGAALAASMLLPSLGLLAVWNAQKALFPIFDHADFGPLDLRHILPWSIPLNLLVSAYLFLSVHGLWDRKLPSKELRFMLPVALSALYVVACFLLIFGRSWSA